MQREEPATKRERTNNKRCNNSQLKCVVRRKVVRRMYVTKCNNRQLRKRVVCVVGVGVWARKRKIACAAVARCRRGVTGTQETRGAQWWRKVRRGGEAGEEGAKACATKGAEERGRWHVVKLKAAAQQTTCASAGAVKSTRGKMWCGKINVARRPVRLSAAQVNQRR